jgi:hypothetical protein
MLKQSFFDKPSLLAELAQSKRSLLSDKLKILEERPSVVNPRQRKGPEEEFFVMTLLSEILSSSSKNSIIESQQETKTVFK